MPQPDSGDNCCDCPSRTGPCDDCGATGACCIFGVCSILSENDCVTSSGFYKGNGTDCDPDPCTDLGCCTYFDEFSRCITTTADVCALIPGAGFGGDNFFCWPEGGAVPPTTASNCCSPSESTCLSNDEQFYFCCPEGETCCNEECCTEGQFCNGVFCE